MTDVATLKDAQDALVAVPLDLTLVLSPYGTEIPETLSDEDGDLLELPDPWDTVGEVQKSAGVSLTPDITTADVEGYGSLGARRTIVTKEAFSIDATLQEYLRRLNFELYYRTKMANTVPNAQSGEVRTIKPNNSGIIYYSGILIASDGALGEEIYPYWITPRISVTKTGALSMKMEAEMATPVTLSVYPQRVRTDWETAGPFAFGVAGRGWKALVDGGKTGFTTKVNEVQVITITGGPTGGTFTLTYGGQTTAAIPYNAAAGAVQAALEALSNIAPGDVTVTGAAGGPYTITFTGTLAGTNVAQITATASLTGGTSPAITPATTTPGKP